MTNKVTLIKTTEDLNKESKLLVQNIGKLDTRIQVYLLSEIAHIEEHRNPTRLNDFFDKVKGKGSRTAAMHSFIQTHANLRLPTDVEIKNGWSQSHYKMKTKRSKDAFETSFKETIETPWTGHKPDPKVQDFSLEGQVQRIIKKALELQAKPRDAANDVIDPDLLKKLVAVTGYKVEEKA